MRKPAGSSDATGADEERKAAVLGKPIEHSLSPVLHRAAYHALGLAEWSYDRIEADAATLADVVRGMGPEWVGVSVTMPGKRAALELASECTDRAAAVGAANTLVRSPARPDGTPRWFADCTDVDGVVGAVRAACGQPDVAGGSSARSGVVLGAGGTAAAAVVGLAELGISHVTLVAREPARAQETLAAARTAGLHAEVVRLDEADLSGLAGSAAVLVSTVPPDVTAPHAAALARAACVVDVIYDPWPTPLADAVHARGGRIATGLDMLLHQAFGQVEQFTGLPAPREAMRAALREATGDAVPLPLSGER
ncbi:shikimate dehydrogenase [Haloechinothrix sp. YIM 98757]|uniref:Shikimate dehydrogenase n=1 Tax=Haloechinothrix aidingensis TaxID=2752311 RepID=A0A838A945_9PSEU|nr:shikimate dehydrogenase [Haloechinothrix aidingensis]MBA0125998.1 shikimate dehydrogenase [Haloechinothrix aidingensis]